MLSTMAERPLRIGTDGDDEVRAMTFTEDGRYLLACGARGVTVSLVKDQKQTARMKAESVNCLAVSKDGRMIAAGTMLGVLTVWDTTTYDEVFSHGGGYSSIHGIDFSPDSARLVAALSTQTASVWDIATRKQVQTLRHKHWVSTAKYSSRGDRIATATYRSVRIWDSSNGRLLMHIPVEVTPYYNTGLVWLNNHLFVASNSKVKRLEASNGSVLSEWTVPGSNGFSRIALPKHGEFIAYSENRSVSFWDTSTHSRLTLIQHTQDIRSIEFSPDGRFLAIGGQDGQVTIKNLKDVLPPSYSTLPFINVTDTPLDLWKQGRLADTEASLTEAISKSQHHSHHALANRALVRAHLGRWDLAINDANKSIEIRPSVIGYIAKSVALVLMGKKWEGCRTYDFVFKHCAPIDVDLLLLVKAVIFFMAGEHDDALSRVGDLIATVHSNSIYYVVQAYMHFLGNSLQSFEHARAKMRYCTGSRLLAISLISGWKFDDLGIKIQRSLYEALHAAGRTEEAGESLLKMVHTIHEEVNISGPMAQWVSVRLEDFGDAAMYVHHYDKAISWYSAALSLHLDAPQGLLIKRSKAHVSANSFEDALRDADKVIELDPTSPWGYERKHAALHKAGDYKNAIHAFEKMLSVMTQSHDQKIREGHDQYIDPKDTKEAIRRAVRDAIRDSPHVLINTDSGRLLDKPKQATAFESYPDFDKLISSMTTQIDDALIEHDVTQYYRYAMFSHKWEESEPEPSFENVIHIVVYTLDGSLTHDKLRMFCRIVQANKLHWAWSDTCCINKADPATLQEALVSMFKWYQGSALTLVLLRGVRSPSRRGDLVKSIWNTRAWTLQEYHASKVVRFYNEDWTLYRNIGDPNHKESAEIISEMEEATRVSVQTLMALQPGSSNIREKLCLASARKAEREEDEAYSLLGIFSLSLRIGYGEKDQALGRLLAQLLTSSGDTTILAWTGKSGSFNSCLPSKIAVFSQSPTLHIPPAIADAEIMSVAAELRALPDPTLATTLYDRLNELSVPSFAVKRMTLPCIAFKLKGLRSFWSGSEQVFRAETAALGSVEIRTVEDLSRLSHLYLVYPWIDFLLERRPIGSLVEMLPEENTGDRCSTIGELPLFPGSFNVAPAIPQSRPAQFASRFGLSFGRRATGRTRDATLLPPSTVAQTDVQMPAVRVLARLRQPFGALLLAKDHDNIKAFKRVATESLITVRVENITPVVLNELIKSVRSLDVL